MEGIVLSPWLTLSYQRYSNIWDIQCHWPKRKLNPQGWMFFQYEIMASFCIHELFMMLWPLGVVGHLNKFLWSVHLVIFFCWRQPFCNRGGFPTLRHYEIRHIRASFSTEVCSNVTLEPIPQELSGGVLSCGSANLRTEKITRGSIKLLISSGAWEKKGPFLTYIYLIHLHLPRSKTL